MAENNAKVLVVDDEPDIIEMLKVLLEDESYEVVTANNGKEVVDKAKEEKPDVIVLYLMMPEMNGFEACEKIKEDPELSDTPVLILTGITRDLSHTRYSRSSGLGLASDDYIDKPVDPDLLLERIAALLGE